MNDFPFVIGIRNHNGARHLAHALHSLMKQNTPLRWWLQDAQSSDESLELARALARPGDTICCEKDQGQADGLNKAFAKMGGEIVGYISSADALLPGAARRILDTFQAHPEIDMVVGAIQYIDEDGKPLRVHRGRIHSLEEMLDLYNVWWKERQFVPPGVFWRRALWEKVGPFQTKYSLAFDYEYWVRCFRAGVRIHFIDEPLSEFRVHTTQKSTASTHVANEIRNIVLENLAEPLPVRPRFRWKLRQRLLYDRYQSGQDNEADGSRPTFLQKLKRNPGWLIVPEVRRRLWLSLHARLFPKKEEDLS